MLLRMFVSSYAKENEPQGQLFNEGTGRDF